MSVRQSQFHNILYCSYIFQRVETMTKVFRNWICMNRKSHRPREARFSRTIFSDESGVQVPGDERNLTATDDLTEKICPFLLGDLNPGVDRLLYQSTFEVIFAASGRYCDIPKF